MEKAPGLGRPGHPDPGGYALPFVLNPAVGGRARGNRALYFCAGRRRLLLQALRPADEEAMREKQ